MLAAIIMYFFSILKLEIQTSPNKMIEYVVLYYIYCWFDNTAYFILYNPNDN